MHSSAVPVSPLPGSAAERLIGAAERVFAREGIASATTREIAKEADVNEVTLFRNFQTKQGLLAAVLERAFLTGDSAGLPRRTIESGATLGEVLHDFAAMDFERKRRNITLMRVLVGEAHRLGHQGTEVLRRIFRPWKDELAAQLREARRRGVMRPDADPVIVVDQLVAMLFIGALRSEMMKGVVYSPETYFEASVQTILRSIEVPPKKRRRP